MRDRFSELEKLIDEARAARRKHEALFAACVSPDHLDGPMYKVGAPLDELGRLDREANLAAGKAHKQLDAIIRGKDLR